MDSKPDAVVVGIERNPEVRFWKLITSRKRPNKSRDRFGGPVVYKNLLTKQVVITIDVAGTDIRSASARHGTCDLPENNHCKCL